VIAGWAINPKTFAPVDAVFLTYDGAGGESIIFSVARLNGNREDISRKMGNAAYEWSGWVAPISVDRLPADRVNFVITAWVLNADTGKAVPLDGQLRFTK